jgi:NAD(P)-dependent dehydrogenase (short-subunit alcohol dehydrogenase family)
MTVQGKAVLIPGGTSGIGRRVADLLSGVDWWTTNNHHSRGEVGGRRSACS